MVLCVEGETGCVWMETLFCVCECGVMGVRVWRESRSVCVCVEEGVCEEMFVERQGCVCVCMCMCKERLGVWRER